MALIIPLLLSLNVYSQNLVDRALLTVEHNTITLRAANHILMTDACYKNSPIVRKPTQELTETEKKRLLFLILAYDESNQFQIFRSSSEEERAFQLKMAACYPEEKNLYSNSSSTKTMRETVLRGNLFEQNRGDFSRNVNLQNKKFYWHQ